MIDCSDVATSDDRDRAVSEQQKAAAEADSPQEILASLFIRQIFAVDDFVAVRTSPFNANQQFSTRSVQQVQYQ